MLVHLLMHVNEFRSIDRSLVSHSTAIYASRGVVMLQVGGGAAAAPAPAPIEMSMQVAAPGGGGNAYAPNHGHHMHMIGTF